MRRCFSSVFSTCMHVFYTCPNLGGDQMIEFVKMHGIGNDFVVIACDQVPPNVAHLAQAMCARHTGIGADGVVWIVPSAQATAKMRIFNADGSESGQCGNAIRCAAKYLWDCRRVQQSTFTIETIGAGVQRVALFFLDDIVDRVEVDMGMPLFENYPSDHSEHTPQSLVLAEHSFVFHAVSMGNPHCVIHVPDVDAFDVATFGRKIECHPYFPQRTNVEFITVTSSDRLRMRVWERGVGETLACGSGACAAVVVAASQRVLQRQATVELLGGVLHIVWDETTNRVAMTGAVQTVFEGRWNG